MAKSHVVTLHACMFGSTRRKSTTLVSNRSWFRRTAVLCSGDHAHESWGQVTHEGKRVWSTSLESAYTPQLAKAWASCAGAAVKDVLEKAPVGRKRAFKALCEPDFAVKVTLTGDDAARFFSFFPPCKIPRHWDHWPKGSKLLEIDREGANPRRARCVLPPEMLVALAADAAEDTIKLAKSRTEASRDLLRVCKGSVSREAALREGLDPEVNHVTSSKMSVALELLLREVGHVDPDVAESVRVGFPLVNNWLPVSGL